MQGVKSLKDVEAALAAFTPVVFAENLHRPQHMHQLMEFLGNPQEQYKVIHVAGSSGKTSTAYYTAALLHAAGKRVGLNISPHAEAINERVQVDMQPLAEEAFCTEFAQFLELIRQVDLPLNYFQVITAFAFWEFARQGVEYAVVEVGIGGLADSTNVVQREDKICVITDIGYAHTRILGHTLHEIAANKAGIIHSGNAVFCRQQTDEITSPIRERARAKHADLHLVDEVSEYDFLPPFQQRNFAMAKAAAQFALARDETPRLSAALVEQAARTHVPARLEIHRLRGKTVVLDAAHTPQKAQALVTALQAQFPGQAMAALFVPTHGKRPHHEGMLRELAQRAQHILLSSFPPEQSGRFGSADPQDIQAIARDVGIQTQTLPDVPTAFAALLERPEPLLVITGSFYVLNHVRPLLQRAEAA